MSADVSSKPQKVGGEYGEVRASIDIDRLNAYLERNVKAIVVPISVKQFKVCSSSYISDLITSRFDIFQFGQVNIDLFILYGNAR